ncbi:MAG: L,D-transpeptidase family protein [Nitrospirae bacterium]|nr:L,D-transpeptidase family protein [Nitrospirota bacterium]
MISIRRYTLISFVLMFVVCIYNYSTASKGIQKGEHKKIQKEGQNDEQELLSGNVFTDTERSFNVLLVDKSKENLYIVEVKDNVPNIAKNLSVITGKNGGDKLKEGDHKTPEGIYFVTKYIPPERLDKSVFGEGAWPLNYPNIVDRYMGKTGHGIWIHGRGPNRTDERTKGCVSLQNSDIEGIKPYIAPSTPVVIASSLEFLRAEDYKKKRKLYFDIFRGFISSWEKGDFEGFANYFDTSFKDADGLTSTNYLSKKKQLMKTYPDRKVITSDISIFTENSKDLMYKFNQLYCASNMLSYGTKKLYLKMGGDKDYRIIAEEFDETGIDTLMERHVMSLIGKWQGSWQGKDIERYMSFYSQSFYSDNMDHKQWKTHKKGLFRTSRTIKVDIRNIDIKLIAPQKVQVAFKQRYSSDTVSDTGTKTLILSGCPGDYKIMSETWRAGS